MEGWQRLGQRIASERARRWRSRSAFARAAGVSARVVDDLELGRRSNYAPSTLSAVEAALGWAAGSCVSVVRGGKVRREVDPGLARLMEVWPRLSPDARVILVELAEAAERVIVNGRMRP